MVGNLNKRAETIKSKRLKFSRHTQAHVFLRAELLINVCSAKGNRRKMRMIKNAIIWDDRSSRNSRPLVAFVDSLHITS